MTRPVPIRRAALVALAALAACHTHGGEPGAGSALRWTFEDPPSGTLPADWEAAETEGAGTPAVWTVQAVDDAASGRQVMRVRTENRDQTYNLLLAQGVHGPDLELSVRLRARAGSEDRGGGLLWSAGGPDDYLVARWNPLEDNLRLYEVRSGRRRMLASADVHATADEWHDLAVHARGRAITVLFDGVEVLHHTVEASLAAGRIGLWTKADATTDFDDLAVAGARI